MKQKCLMWLFCIFVLFTSFSIPVFSNDVELGEAPRLTKYEYDQYSSFQIKQTPVEDPSTSVPPVDTSDPSAVASHYEDYFLSTRSIDLSWTGNMAECDPGTISLAHQQATIQAVNFFRAMTGLPGNVVHDESLSVKCQDSSLMMIAQANLSHFPGESWACFTEDGAEAAGKSNLALGNFGAGAVQAYIQDDGFGNEVVGHRRWILYPPQMAMGTGDTDVRNQNFPGSNTLWVIGSFGARPQSPEWVAWPPSGYVPYQLVFHRWSFSRSNANFSNTSVMVTTEGENVNLTVLPVQNGFGDNTLVWEVEGFPSNAPTQPVTYSVELTDVMIGGQAQSFSYDVIMYNHKDFLGTSDIKTWHIHNN